MTSVGKEIGTDLLTKAVVVVVLVGCVFLGGVLGAQVNNDVAVIVGGAIGLVVGIPAAVLVGARLRRHLQ